MKINRLLNCAALAIGAALTVTIGYAVDDESTQYMMIIAMVFITAKIAMDIVFE